MANDIIELEKIDLGDIKTLDQFFKFATNAGTIEQALGNNLYGINQSKSKSALPDNKDSTGYTFFTRPQLNLSTYNIQNTRLMYNYMASNKSVLHGYVRHMLDPRLRYTEQGLDSPFVDPYNPFIPILSNTINTLSGWPDIALPTFTSKPGVRKEAWSIADGATEIYDVYDLDATFRNVQEEPTILLFHAWILYMAYVFEGMLSPYMDMITENEIDYNTRIYRLIMDPTNRYVKKIAATGASYPLNVPTGRMFDHNSNVTYSDQAKEINIRFKCMGAMYNDPILYKEFNETVAIFNPRVRNMLNGTTNHGLEKIPHTLIDLLRHRGYPVINMKTFELEWYISKDSPEYKKLINLVKKG